MIMNGLVGLYKVCVLGSDSSPSVWVPVSRRSPHTIKEENPYVTLLACWASQEEADTDSSNEEDDTGASPAPSGAEGPMEGDPAHNTSSTTTKYVYGTTKTTSSTSLHPNWCLFVLQPPVQSGGTSGPHAAGPAPSSQPIKEVAETEDAEVRKRTFRKTNNNKSPLISLFH